MKKISLVVGALLCLKIAFAQPGALDLTFDPGIGFDRFVNTLALQPDGKIIVGGNFESYNWYSINKAARLHPDGEIDTTFHSGFPGTPFQVIYTSALQPDGKIIFGGGFRTYFGDSINRIIRLNSDGSRDTTFQVGTGFNDGVKALAIQPDGKIIVGGYFTQYNGYSCNRLARLNADGSFDTTFNTIIGANGGVEVAAIQRDGKIVIGGDFTIYGNLNHPIFMYCQRVARVNTDGSRDSTFLPALGASAVVGVVTIQPDGNVLIGGNFNQYNSEPQKKIARLKPSADLEGFCNNGGANGSLGDIKLFGNGNILLAGTFNELNDTQVHHGLVVVDTFGNINYEFNKGGTGPDWHVGKTLLLPNGKIIISGEFSTYNGIPRRTIARLYNCLLAQPDSIIGNDSTTCPGEVFVFSVPPVADAERYEWILPAGWTGSSDSNSITAISNDDGGVVSVRAFNDSCGFSYATTKTIYRVGRPQIPLCLVTVDSQSTHNIIVWEKPADRSLIDSFFIYRETITGVFSKMGTVHRDSLSEFHDTTANPNTTAYNYKISMLDVCGLESDMSLAHKTIHLQNTVDGNINWTQYEIENVSPTPVSYYKINRDTLGNGNFEPLDSVPGTNTSFTDNNYFKYPNARYLIDVIWNISCSPSRNVNTTRSNIRKIAFIKWPPDTIPDDTIPDDTTTVIIEVKNHISIYPNPSNDKIFIELAPSANVTRLKFFNALGMLLWSENLQNRPNVEMKIIPVGNLPRGMHVLAIETVNGVVKRKIILE